MAMTPEQREQRRKAGLKSAAARRAKSTVAPMADRLAEDRSRLFRVKAQAQLESMQRARRELIHRDELTVYLMQLGRALQREINGIPQLIGSMEIPPEHLPALRSLGLELSKRLRGRLSGAMDPSNQIHLGTESKAP